MRYINLLTFKTVGSQKTLIKCCRHPVPVGPTGMMWQAKKNTAVYS